MGLNFSVCVVFHLPGWSLTPAYCSNGMETSIDCNFAQWQWQDLFPNPNEERRVCDSKKNPVAREIVFLFSESRAAPA